MSQKAEFKPASLAQHFEAPDNYVGHFAWICGYSADAIFLNDAIERFVRQTRSQRSYTGRIITALILDPGSPQITPIDVPGVIHLALQQFQQRPFRLLHAKIAVLGFRHTTSDGWLIRLIVSTGNWTQQTLEESLDLAWCVDISSQSLESLDEKVKQSCADLKAAWRMMTWLREYFDYRALYAKQLDGMTATVSSDACAQMETWIAAATRKARGRARFFDNQKESLLAQLPNMVKQAGSDVSRNYIAMGSGFYEQSAAVDEIPSVLNAIVKTLQNSDLLTQGAEKDVFVNPKSCQAVANALPAFKPKFGWSVRFAGQPGYFGSNANRSLHAKFIFSANQRNNSAFASSGWLYLGSGNLTGPGFNNKMSTSGGNLEAGVVLATSASLRWRSANKIPAEDVLTNLLPVQWETAASDFDTALAYGSDMPDREAQFYAAPVAWMHWRATDAGGLLWTLERTATEFEVLDERGSVCERDDAGEFVWCNTQPRTVLVQWLDSSVVRKAWIPVMDKFGRLAASKLPLIDIDEAWAQLESFPMLPSDEDIPSDHQADDVGAGDFTLGQGRTVVAVYPVRQMMQLIENIASKQTEVHRDDWTAWCTRLEQCLVQASNSAVLIAFRKLELNPITPLLSPPFRPGYALGSDGDYGRRYELALNRIQIAWGVNDFKRLGDFT